MTRLDKGTHITFRGDSGRLYFGYVLGYTTHNELKMMSLEVGRLTINEYLEHRVTVVPNPYDLDLIS